MDDDRRPARHHPWWQTRLATAGRTTALAVVAAVLAVAMLAGAAAQVAEGRPPFLLVAGLFWVPYAVVTGAGAVAQRRERDRV